MHINFEIPAPSQGIDGIDGLAVEEAQDMTAASTAVQNGIYGLAICAATFGTVFLVKKLLRTARDRREEAESRDAQLAEAVTALKEVTVKHEEAQRTCAKQELEISELKTKIATAA